METAINLLEKIMTSSNVCCCFAGAGRVFYVFALFLLLATFIAIIVTAVWGKKENLLPLAALSGILLICFIMCNLWSSIVAIICCTYIGVVYISSKNERKDE